MVTKKSGRQLIAWPAMQAGKLLAGIQEMLGTSYYSSDCTGWTVQIQIHEIQQTLTLHVLAYQS